MARLHLLPFPQCWQRVLFAWHIRGTWGPTLDRRIVVPRSDPSVSAAWATVSLARGSKVEGRSLSTTGV